MDIGQFYSLCYEEEKQWHEEALQRYQEDHMDEVEIISLHKRCNRTVRKAPQPKKVPKSPEFIESSEEEIRSKKASKSPELIKSDDSSDDEQGPKKAPRHQDKDEKILLRVNEDQRFFDLRKKSKNLTIEKKVGR